MIPLLSRARTLPASGRRGLWALLTVAGAVACTTVGSDVGDPSAAEPLDPPIRLSAGGAVEDAEARELMVRASEALEVDPHLAIRLAQRVVDKHPEASGSGRALRILVQGTLRAGRYAETQSWAEQYARLLPPADDRVVDVWTLAGDAALEDERPTDAVLQWLRIPADADVRLLGAVRARIEAFAPMLGGDALRRLVAGLPEGSPFGEALTAALAASTDFTPILGVVLPTTGSPRLREFAEEIRQGIQVAVDEFDSTTTTTGPARLLTRDNRGTIEPSAGIVGDLERDGALGIIGPLQDVTLEEVARVRTDRLTIVSPTSPTIPGPGGAVYSLQGAEDGASRALARYAADRGILTAAILHPDNPEATFEAEAFRAGFEELGGQVLASISYLPGSTYFEEQMRAAASVRPDVLVLPIPARDVELVAPQVTFFGLDSLGIEVLGTGGWTDRQILGRVDPRHTNGVVAATPQPAEGEPAGARGFRQAYEGFFSNTLRSTVPAYGYDAARLLLEAVRRGARTAADVSGALEGLRDFEGATGRLSVRDGRLTREHYVICIQDQRPQDLQAGERPSWTLMPPLPDPETDSIPPGVPPRIVGFRCPGAPLPPGALPDSIFHPDSAYILPDTLPPDTLTSRDPLVFLRRSRR